MRHKVQDIVMIVVISVGVFSLVALFIFSWVSIGVCAGNPPSPAYEEYLHQMEEAGIPPNGYWNGCRQQEELDKWQMKNGFYPDIYGYGWSGDRE